MKHPGRDVLVMEWLRLASYSLNRWWGNRKAFFRVDFNDSFFIPLWGCFAIGCFFV